MPARVRGNSSNNPLNIGDLSSLAEGIIKLSASKSNHKPANFSISDESSVLSMLA